jgi:hypothetical protein
MLIVFPFFANSRLLVRVVPQLPDLLQLFLGDAQLVKLHRRTAKLLVPPENAGGTGS